MNGDASKAIMALLAIIAVFVVGLLAVHLIMVYSDRSPVSGDLLRVRIDDLGVLFSQEDQDESVYRLTLEIENIGTVASGVILEDVELTLGNENIDDVYRVQNWGRIIEPGQKAQFTGDFRLEENELEGLRESGTVKLMVTGTLDVTRYGIFSEERAEQDFTALGMVGFV
jgi:hypothetical protein